MDDLGNRSDRRTSAARTGAIRADDPLDDRRTAARREARQAVGEPADPDGRAPQPSAADDVPPPTSLVPLPGAGAPHAGAAPGGMEGLGARLKELRQQAGFSLRELARQADVSPSLVSQIENGKSRPSVSTLYTFARLLSVPVDELFDAEEPALAELPAAQAAGGDYDPANVWHQSEYATRISVIHPSHRAQLHMAEGVAWERLAATPERDVNFMKVTYAPGAGSGEGAERQLHDGYEYGYVLTGTLEVTVGNEVFVLHEGESLGFDSTIPHRFRNIGDSDFQGIWFVHGHSH